MKSCITLTFVLVLVAAPPAAAQSIFASRGLGVPVSSADARARTLGGIGVGIRDRNLSLTNPAEAADFRFRGLIASLQSSNRTVDFNGVTADAASNRFPLLHLVYPVGQRFVFSVGYGGFLDQTWAAFEDRTTVIGDDTVTVRDAIDSSGGLSQVQLGAAYSLTPGLSVGIAGGFYTGELDREIARSFIGGKLNGVSDFRQRETWSQRAPFATAGFRWDIASIARIAGSATWAGTLRGDPESGDAESFEVDLPLQLAGGASALLAPELLAAVSARWSGWSRAANGVDGAEAPLDTWEVGGGLEWRGVSSGDRILPLRVGYHYSEYPFRVGGVTPTERALAFGLGLWMRNTDFGPLAAIDAAIERGQRDAKGTGLGEDFWRFTVSLSVFGQ